MRNSLRLGCAEAFCEQDPALAGSLLAQAAPDGDFGRIAGKVATTWFERDPEAARQWVVGLDSNQSRTPAVVTLARAWAKTSSEDALAWVQRTAESSAQRDEFVSSQCWRGARGRHPVGHGDRRARAPDDRTEADRGKLGPKGPGRCL